MKNFKYLALFGGFWIGMMAGLPLAQAETFDQFLSSVQREAVAAGVAPSVAAQALADLEPNDRVVVLDRKQPEKRLTFARYIKGVLDPLRVRQGKKQLQQWGPALRAASARYQVPPALIVALWGMESNFGANTGGFSVIESLATLAYEGRRADFFRGELIAALRILQQEGLQASDLSGSWAGAMGQCQFMPSTYLRYAADGDGDGRRDIWDSQADVIASIARYIAAEGWQGGGRWGREVRLSRRIEAGLLGLDTARPLSFWAAHGVRPLGGKTLPNNNIKASLVLPDGPGGRAFLVYDNFRALMRWNHSTYFGLSVGLLADRLSLSR